LVTSPCFFSFLTASRSSADVDFLYNGFQHTANLSLDGSASILHGGALQLTNDSNKLIGHTFFDSPVQAVRDSVAVSKFSTAFVFDIMTIDRAGGHGQGRLYIFEGLGRKSPFVCGSHHVVTI
jgi:hypothetical protein